MELAEPLLIEWVPDIDKTITASGCKCVVTSVKGHSIDWIDVLSAILFYTMALECILLLLDLCICVQVFNCHSERDSEHMLASLSLKCEQH